MNQLRGAVNVRDATREEVYKAIKNLKVDWATVNSISLVSCYSEPGSTPPMICKAKDASSKWYIRTTKDPELTESCTLQLNPVKAHDQKEPPEVKFEWVSRQGIGDSER